MEGQNFGKKTPIEPTDVTSPAGSRQVQEELLPPSHFTSCVQSAGASRGVKIQGTPPTISCINPAVKPVTLQAGDPSAANPWLVITQAQQEIIELRKENQRLMMLQRDSIRGRMALDHSSDLTARHGSAERSEQWSRWESEWRLEAKKHKAEAERLKEQVESLKESTRRYIEEIRDSDSVLKRQSHELEATCEELCKAKTEFGQLREELIHSNAQKAEISSQLDKLRLTSLNEILTLQGEKYFNKTSTDPLVKNGSEDLQMLQLWREKAFKLCVQLRLKDIELKEERDKHRSKVSKEELAQAQKEALQLKSESQKAEHELKVLTETVHRFNVAFSNKVAEVETAQSRLKAFMTRLTFAKRRVETIQDLLKRRVALQKVQQASKQAEQASDCITNLRTELSLVSEERDKLTQELKRTPELIEKALVDLKEHYESKLRQQQQDLEQSWMGVRQAVADREEAEQSLQQIQTQLEESKVNEEKLCSELLIQQERSDRALLERVSEIEDRCAERLMEMEVQLNIAKEEHTKAVKTLLYFERDERIRKQEELKEFERKEKDKTLLAAVAEGELMNECTRNHTTSQNSAGLSEQQQKPSPSGNRSRPSCSEANMSLLEELQTLSAAALNSSEDSFDDED